MPQKINLTKKLENFYGTEVYHRVSKDLILTDGVEELLKIINEKDNFYSMVMLQNVENRLDKSKQYGILFMELIIKDNKFTIKFYDDIPEVGHRYNYKEELQLERFNDGEDFVDCKIKTFIQSGVWALLSEY